MTCRVPGKKSIQFRPDLAIVKNGVLTHSLDLKMDMGYKRRYFETEAFENLQKRFNIFRKQSFESVSYKKNDKSQRYLDVSSKIKNQIVVISEKNGGKSSNRRDMILDISKRDWVNIYYLTGEVHPNNNSNETPILNNVEFERLIKDVKALI